VATVDGAQLIGCGALLSTLLPVLPVAVKIAWFHRRGAEILPGVRTASWRGSTVVTRAPVFGEQAVVRNHSPLGPTPQSSRRNEAAGLNYGRPELR
jgi:hypothetical protein